MKATAVHLNVGKAARGRSLSLVADANFVVATRDTGYKSSAYAIAELIDNAIQAGARSINIFVRGEHNRVEEIGVLDDGNGIAPSMVPIALQFGGTDRFDDRSGMGRFGMGLPNSSLSQARRVELYSWRNGTPFCSYLDVDEIATRSLIGVPAPTKGVMLPAWITENRMPRSGTLVTWRKCDRLEATTCSKLCAELHCHLGRLFRYKIWAGLRLAINRERVRPFDPLLLKRESPECATLFGSILEYPVRVPLRRGITSTIQVTFTELPIEPWSVLPAAVKKQLGIIGGAGVSIVRADREIAYGWFFMGSKRKENYDDWWRCEVRFQPRLDELFRLTHTKQQIIPSPDLETLLVPDLENIARILNNRVRHAFISLRSKEPSLAAKTATLRDRQLPALPSQDTSAHRFLRDVKYRVVVESGLRDNSFYSCRIDGKEIVLVLNESHPFYRKMYTGDGSQVSDNEKFRIECLLLAAARAELEATSAAQRWWYRRKRNAWSNVLAAFLGN